MHDILGDNARVRRVILILLTIFVGVAGLLAIVLACDPNAVSELITSGLQKPR